MSIKMLFCAALAMCSLGYTAQPSRAQVIVTPVVPAPVVVAPAPVVVGSNYTAGYSSYSVPTYSTLSPVVTTSAYSTLSPVVTAAPVVTTPTYSTLSPVVTAAPMVTAAPVVTYRPVVTSYSVPYVTARPVIVRPTVYVPGQPVRNFFRAIAP